MGRSQNRTPLRCVFLLGVSSWDQSLRHLFFPSRERLRSGPKSLPGFIKSLSDGIPIVSRPRLTPHCGETFKRLFHAFFKHKLWIIPLIIFWLRLPCHGEKPFPLGFDLGSARPL